MAKYAKAPWKMKNYEVFSKDGEGICVPYSISNRDLSNMRLISKAPDLLDALKEIDEALTEFAGDVGSRSRMILARARAQDVIAKAEGKRLR